MLLIDASLLSAWARNTRGSQSQEDPLVFLEFKTFNIFGNFHYFLWAEVRYRAIRTIAPCILHAIAKKRVAENSRNFGISYNEMQAPFQSILDLHTGMNAEIQICSSRLAPEMQTCDRFENLSIDLSNCRGILPVSHIIDLIFSEIYLFGSRSLK